MIADLREKAPVASRTRLGGLDSTISLSRTGDDGDDIACIPVRREERRVGVAMVG
jgi:hypothetical protein